MKLLFYIIIITRGVSKVIWTRLKSESVTITFVIISLFQPLSGKLIYENVIVWVILTWLTTSPHKIPNASSQFIKFIYQYDGLFS